jgi:hypothetical protein
MLRLATARRFSLSCAATLLCVAGCGGAAANLARTAPPTVTVSDERRCHFDRSHGAIFGTLIDQHGKIIAGVTVLATSPALRATGPASLVSITDETGVFAFSDLPPGRYDLTFYFDRATENVSRDVEANTVWPYRQEFTKAPRGDIEYLAKWRMQRVTLPHRESESSIETDYIVEGCFAANGCSLSYRSPFPMAGASFSSDCAVGHYPCGPTIARTDYPTFGTSSIVRMNPFASLRQR